MGTILWNENEKCNASEQFPVCAGFAIMPMFESLAPKASALT